MSLELWVIDPVGQPIDVAPAEQDGWVDHLFVALADAEPSTGRSAKGHQPTSEEPYPYMEYAVNSETLKSRLRLIPLKEGFYVLLVGEAPLSDEQIQPWIDAIQAASDRVGQSHQVFQWSAVIGPEPDSLNGHQELDAARTVGPLTIEPAGIRLDEYTPGGAPPTFGGQNVAWSWPAIVKGQARGYNWNVASKDAAAQLHRLCTILSIALDACWVQRHGPYDSSTGFVEVPHKLWWQAMNDRDSGELSHSTASIPSWASSAWALVEQDSALRDSLGAYHEGLLLEARHQSYALIAFISVVESVGARLWPQQCCETCNAVTGSTDRFRRALRIVVTDEEEAKQLTKAYGPRSRTAHAGELHGSETLPGVFPSPSFFSPDPAMTFTWELVFRMGRAARRLLVLALKEELPRPSM